MAKVYLVTEYSTWGQAYSAANNYSPEVEILEILGTGAVIAAGEEAVITHEAQRKSSQKFLIISAEHGDRLLQIFYSLHHEKIQDSILIFENKSLVQIFSEAVSWLTQGIEINDFRATRVSTDPNILIGTTRGDPRPKNLASEVQKLYPINSQLKSFFDIEVGE